MNGMDLLKGFSHIDETLVDEAERKNRRKPSIKWILPIAASFAIIIATASMLLHNKTLRFQGGSNQTENVIEEGSETAGLGGDETEKYKLYFNTVKSEVAASLIIRGHFWEELTSLQTEKLMPNLAQKYQTDGTVHYSHTDNAASIFSVNTSVTVGGKTVKITIAPNEVMKCYLIEGEPILSEIKGVKIEAGIFTTDKNSRGEQKHIYHANFKMDDVAYYVEYAGDEADSEFFTTIIADVILGGKADLSILDNPTAPELREDMLNEKEAYIEPDFGAYLPNVPNSYSFNDAIRFVNQEEDYLFASWSQEYDDISIRISKLKEKDVERIVSVQDKELYDMSLYPIPWAESMPRDKAHIIENPIFKTQDLTADILNMREYIRGEQGDPSAA